ncbi:hypothetical protein STEG23_014481, partial [Scotinomys teguina]
DADSSERIIIPMRWGLVPSWFKESDPSKLQFNTSNCRSDTIMEKQSFKVPLGKGRRCVVLADGFYEWQRCQGTSQRQPYFIYFPQIKTEKCSLSLSFCFPVELRLTREPEFCSPLPLLITPQKHFQTSGLR